MIVLSVAKPKMFSTESEIFLWIKPRKEKKNFFCGKFGSMPTFRSTRKGKKCFCDEPTCVWPQGGYITSHLHHVFFDFARIFSYFKCLEFKEFNKTVIPFTLVGYETGYICHLISNARSWNNCWIFSYKCLCRLGKMSLTFQLIFKPP